MRKGDKIEIEGGYQHNAIQKGNIFQRNWHILKLKTAVNFAKTGSNSAVLDVACGSGTIIPFLAGNIAQYTGLDANPKAIAFARKTYNSPVHHFRLFQIDDLAQLPAGASSHIFFLEIIEHLTVQQGKDALCHFFKLLSLNGTCIISTPNRHSLWPAIEWLMDMLHLAPKLKGEQHEHLYTVKELRTIAANAGFTVGKTVTINGVAPWLSFLGKRQTEKIHNWELRNNWFPGSLIIMALEKPA